MTERTRELLKKAAAIIRERGLTKYQLHPLGRETVGPFCAVGAINMAHHGHGSARAEGYLWHPEVIEAYNHASKYLLDLGVEVRTYDGNGCLRPAIVVYNNRHETTAEDVAKILEAAAEPPALTVEQIKAGRKERELVEA